MDNKQKVLSMLGLAARARKLISGEELVVKGIQNGQIFFAIISEDVSDNTRKKIKDKCLYYKIPYQEIFNREELGKAIGKNARVVIGVSDIGFSREFEKLLK